LNEHSGISDAWLLQHVVPNMMQSPHISHHREVALVLALPLLWACFDDEMEAYMPTPIRNAMQHAYNEIQHLPQNVVPPIPVKKTLLIVSGSDATLRIDSLVQEICQVDGNANAAGGNGNVQPMTMMTNQTNATLQALYSQLVSLRQEMQERFSNVDQRFRQLENRVNTVNRNIQHIALQPVQRRAPIQPALAVPEVEQANNKNNARIGEEGIDPLATLSPRPNTLAVLWLEYECGIGGRKPAKDFTTAERGRCTKTYYRRNLVWRKIDHLVRAGHSYEVASHMLQMQYGANLSVTEIIKRIIAEQPHAVRNH
jgi:hypothetical protein